MVARVFLAAFGKLSEWLLGCFRNHSEGFIRWFLRWFQSHCLGIMFGCLCIDIVMLLRVVAKVLWVINRVFYMVARVFCFFVVVFLPYLTVAGVFWFWCYLVFWRC